MVLKLNDVPMSLFYKRNDNLVHGIVGQSLFDKFCCYSEFIGNKTVTAHVC